VLINLIYVEFRDNSYQTSCHKSIGKLSFTAPAIDSECTFNMQPSIRMFFKAKQTNHADGLSERQAEEPKAQSNAKRAADDDGVEVRTKRQLTSPIITSTPSVNGASETVRERRTSTDVASTPSKHTLTQENRRPVELQSPSIVASKVDSGQADSESRNHPHLAYKFLYPPDRRDINKRRPEDPNYDEKTLYIPSQFLDSQTPALRQWWLIKQNNMDAILFFKMGKFYELFNEDAVIAVEQLEIQYMKGDDTKPAHAGFPEVSYEKYARILIDKGYKVMRIEQTETPAMMEDRCQETGRRGKFDRVVKREICRITTKGTQMLGVMDSVFHTSQNQYLLVIYESSRESTSSNGMKSCVYGFCFIDVTIGKLHIGQFDDDHNQSKLNILLSHYTPVEVLFERGNPSQKTYQAILKTGAVLTPLKHQTEFWPIKKALSFLKARQIFQNEASEFEWPCFLKMLFEECDSSDSLMMLSPKDQYVHALNCFGALVYYLQSQLIAEQVLKCVNFDLYVTPLDRSSASLRNSSLSEVIQIPPMILDHIALRNLEIFDNSAGESKATLFESINGCKTHFGQRLLRNWLCSPLCDTNQIERRLCAVEALIDNENASLLNEICHVLGQTPDLERLLSKIRSQCFKSENDARAIMFDDNHYSKAKISSFLNLLQNFKRLQKFVTTVNPSVQNCSSQALKRLLSFTTDGGLYPDYSATLDYFESAFDHDLAKRTGQIIPAPGVDKSYDTCKSNIDDLKNKLESYLDEQKEILKCRQIEYFGTAKNRYQIQIPESYCKNIPSEYRIETTRKGFKRYYTPTIDKLFQRLSTFEEELKKTLDNIMSRIFEQFSRKIKLWSAAIECVAILDVLQSLAGFGRSLKASGLALCRPEFKMGGATLKTIEYTNGHHPSLVKLDANFIPNDLKIDERLILLTGANMGGKSTLMRQTALLVILAQIGCFVPASKMVLTPVDRIFSRLGASDRLLDGESTFYTELVETSAMLHCATKDSLLLIDELGRGTSTYDGTALAYSVLQEISNNIKCRCLFSTHYHSLVRDFQDKSQVRLAHMACKIETESGDQIEPDPLKENITFLYKIAEGPVARSYGFNVAKLAGIQDEIIREAFMKAREFELGSRALETLQKCARADPLLSGSELKHRVLTHLAERD